MGSEDYQHDTMASIDEPQTLSLESIHTFVYERTLSADTINPSIYILGSIHSTPAILHFQKPVFDLEHVQGLVQIGTGVAKLEGLGENDIYSWAMAWFGDARSPDAKINLICPATEVHVRKYSKQKITMFRETPEIYQTIVKPYIDAFPASRTQWVRNILSKKKEADRILFEDPDKETGFLIIPDMKWDQKNLSMLYITAITHLPIPSMRDLNKTHLPLLYKIQTAADEVCKERYGVEKGGLKIFVHYQPSYYHFHVHIVSLENEAARSSIGNAHLLDDLISLIELSPVDPADCLLKKLTLSYVLGEESALYPLLKTATEAETI